MTDIVERLLNPDVHPLTVEDAKIAAEEIEKLRAQVTDLTRLAGCAAIGKEFSEIKELARAKNITINGKPA